MRFIENGPFIPDDLLLARDEGRVVFFCGAGVSRARAGLADFYGLAESVLENLRVQPNHITHKVLHEAKQIGKRTGATGLISADRIFGLLERDFYPLDIESAVASSLKPKANVDLSAHRILLDLATTTEGSLRLVTTNFDRLFEAASNLQPKLLLPSNLHSTVDWSDLNGIVHLHGIVDKDYLYAESDGFILTSSQFGRAYLTEGWATRFFKEILDQFVVVFIGYAADDPPVQYLLEALNTRKDRITEVYAFQEGSEIEAIGKWQHKGVEAIAFDPVDNFCALWNTLELWAKRARLPEEWFNSVIELATLSPKDLKPFERGQVAHVISTAEGARRFAHAEKLPPADWLCVFDPARRYEPPRNDVSPDQLFYSINDNQDPEQQYINLNQKAPIDPFIFYGLDSDSRFNSIEENYNSFKRNIPDSAWNAFQPTNRDRLNLQIDYIPAFLGHYAISPIPLCTRLRLLGVWLSKVADQPAAIWWATKQSILHPEIQREILNSSKLTNPVMRQAWHYLFESWSYQKNEDQNFQNWQDIKNAVDRDGWSYQRLRKYIALQRPFIKVSPHFWHKCLPPDPQENLRLNDLLSLGIEYSDQIEEIEISDEWFAFYTSEYRKNLEYALLIDKEIDGNNRFEIGSILATGKYIDHNSLFNRVIKFSKLFQRLVSLDIRSAQQELAAWPINDLSIFDRLRIWVSGMPELVSDTAFTTILLELGDVVFWDSNSQKDLLPVLSHRWQQLSDESRVKLEERLLAGPQSYVEGTESEFIRWKAWVILNSVYWLADQGCSFSFDLKAETLRLRQAVPEWKKEHSRKVTESMDDLGGVVRTNEDCSELLRENPATILTKSVELSDRSDNFLVENAPFAGLCKEKPIRAFRTLTIAAKNSDFPEWAWRQFLNSPQREHDRPKFSALIAERINSYPSEQLLVIIRQICSWLRKTGKFICSDYYSSYLRIVDKLISTIELQPRIDNSSVIQSNKQVDWVFEAINSTVGDLVEILMFDPEISNLQQGMSLPTSWLSKMERLLRMPNNLHRYVVVVLASYLQWLYYWGQAWTETNLLIALDTKDNRERQAFWSGFLRANSVPNQSLYMHLKPHLLAVTKDESLAETRREHQLIAMLLAGWGSTLEHNGERCITDGELHNLLLHWNDDTRCHVLSLIKQWGKNNESWRQQIPDFLRVWPQQKVARTPRVSAALFELAFSSIEIFEQVIGLILPLLTPLKKPYLHLPSIERILDTYPAHSLELLYKAFSENSPRDLPHGLLRVLDRIVDADSELRASGRWLQLKRKLDS